MPFLDMAGRFGVFIIHGKGPGGDGTGPVAAGIRRLLQQDEGARQYARNFCYASHERGGEGVTQVNLAR